MTAVLFVCLGNICRSPMAEGLFRQLVQQDNLDAHFTCDSAGTAAYHIGELPDSRMRQTAKTHGISLTHRARQFSKEDFENFDYIIAMDRSNFEDIMTLRPENPSLSIAPVLLMREFDSMPSSQDVPDPYYGGLQGFEDVYQLLLRCNRALLDFLKREHRIGQKHLEK